MGSLIETARSFAFAAHNAIDHRRKYTDEPYTTHLERVAALVASVNHDDAMVASAYLHDTVEDTATTHEDIEAQFGDDVAYLVRYLTDVSSLEDGNRVVRKRIDREHIALGNARVHTVKLADLIDNSDSIQAHAPDFAKVYMQEKRQLLEVLRDGDATLYARASSMVDAWFARG